MILYVCVFAKKAESVSIYEVNEGQTKPAASKGDQDWDC